MTDDRDETNSDWSEVTTAATGTTAPSPATEDDPAAPDPAADTTSPADASLSTLERQGLEALLFLAEEPVDVLTLAELLEVDEAAVQAELHRLVEEYTDQQRGMEVRYAAGGWRMYSAEAARPILERWALAGRSGRLTQAALETLSVIAYKQPISRQEIGDIRGVNADGAVRSLVARGYVAEVGRDPGAGQAVLYGTTKVFLERLGLASLSDLPPLTDYLPEAPAPDEPELGTLKEIRRRLAAGGDLPSLGGRDHAATNTGGPDDEADEDDHDNHLPAPTASPRRDDDREMDALTDRLEQAARSAVDRLRQAVAADHDATADADAAEAAADAQEANAAADDSGADSEQVAQPRPTPPDGAQEPHDGR